MTWYWQRKTATTNWHFCFALEASFFLFTCTFVLNDRNQYQSTCMTRVVSVFIADITQNLMMNHKRKSETGSRPQQFACSKPNKNYPIKKYYIEYGT